MKKSAMPWAKLEKLKKPHKLGIFFGTIAILGALFYFLPYSSVTTERTQLGDDLETLDGKIMQHQKTARELPKIREELALVKKKFEMSSELLPERKEVPKLLRDISGYAKESGLNVTLFKPEDRVVMKDFYAEISFTINIEGPFLNMVSFFYKVGGLPRIVNIDDVDMGTPVVIGEDMILKATAAGTTFRFLTPEELKAREEAEKAAAKKARKPKPKKED